MVWSAILWHVGSQQKGLDDEQTLLWTDRVIRMQSYRIGGVNAGRQVPWQCAIDVKHVAREGLLATYGHRRTVWTGCTI